jgi:hypothetical protein
MCTSILNNVLQETSGITPLNMTVMLAFFFIISVIQIYSLQEGTIKLRMGPLKMAAMNGLTMSRPMVLALMNDESRAPKDERVRLKYQ